MDLSLVKKNFNCLNQIYKHIKINTMNIKNVSEISKLDENLKVCICQSEAFKNQDQQRDLLMVLYCIQFSKFRV